MNLFLQYYFKSYLKTLQSIIYFMQIYIREKNNNKLSLIVCIMFSDWKEKEDDSVKKLQKVYPPKW